MSRTTDQTGGLIDKSKQMLNRCIKCGICAKPAEFFTEFAGVWRGISVNDELLRNKYFQNPYPKLSRCRCEHMARAGIGALSTRVGRTRMAVDAAREKNVRPAGR